jgi:GT2 family glycosyltransferase
MPELTASIVVYKSSPKLLLEAIDSFLSGAPESVLYVIDNSPTDEVKMVATHPRVKYIFNGDNVGFGAAHNQALKVAMSSSTYHLVLNPDVNFKPEVISQMVSFMNANPEVGLAMPKVLYPDGRLQYLCRLLPSPTTLFLRRFAFPFQKVKNKINHHYELKFSGYDRVMDVPFLSGCFMFLRMDAVRKSGLFDERIFLYTEDIDLSRRIHKYYRTVFFPDAVIYHHHVRESYKSFRTFLQHASSAVTYFNKWGWFLDTERDRINKKIILKLSQ